jgi:hypothetical protein
MGIFNWGGDRLLLDEVLTGSNKAIVLAEKREARTEIYGWYGMTGGTATDRE